MCFRRNEEFLLCDILRLYIILNYIMQITQSLDQISLIKVIEISCSKNIVLLEIIDFSYCENMSSVFLKKRLKPGI